MREGRAVRVGVGWGRGGKGGGWGVQGWGWAVGRTREGLTASNLR